MEIVRREKRWWIVDMPDGLLDCGPYDSRAEAREERAGLERFIRWADSRGFFTSERSGNARTAGVVKRQRSRRRSS